MTEVSGSLSNRKQTLLAMVEFALVAAVFVADRRHLIPFSKTPFLLAVGWISLRMRAMRWRHIGLRLYRSWPTTLALGAAVGISMELLDLFVTKIVLVRLTGRPPDLSDFLPIVGNLKLAIASLVLAWVVAALGEELVWRGYLMNRVAGLFGNGRASWLVSLLVVSALFGYAHSNQGTAGIFQEAFSGLLLGLAYLVCGRNLAVPIVAHGVTDSIDLILIYTGAYPGLPMR